MAIYGDILQERDISPDGRGDYISRRGVKPTGAQRIATERDTYD